MTALLIIALIVGVLVIVATIGWLIGIAHRLDRLHVRTDAAWAGLDAALARRAVVSRAVAAGTDGVDAEGERLRTAADRAERAPRAEREAAENELTRRLVLLRRDALRPAIRAELVDAEHRVVLARRVHNDAVRDTLSLRSKRIVHWLRLAGSAPLPRYFEIAEPEIDGVPTRQMAWRGCARVLVVDEDDRVLLFRGRDPTRRDEWCWFPPGGGVRGGERPRTTATRELAEQTGLRVDDDAFCGPVWLRRVTFPLDATFPIRGEELFFLLRTNGFGELDGSWSARSKRDTIDEDLSITIDDHRWLTVDEYRWFTVDELVSTSDTVYPEQLTELLPELLAGDWDGQLRTLR